MSRALRAFVALIHPRSAVVAHDLAMILIAWYLAKSIRLSFEADTSLSVLTLSEVVLVLTIQGSIFWWTGLYKGLWRFASLPDLWNIVRGSILGALTVGLALFLYDRLGNVPRSVLILYPVLMSVLLGLPRLAYRFWKDSRLDFYERSSRKRVLVLGAERAGEMLVRDLRAEGQYLPVGFLDDNRLLRGARVHGVPVLGRIEELRDLAREVAADMLLIAMPSATTAEMRRVVELCEETGLPFRTVPRLQDVVAGRSAFNELKEVAIEDLLGREPVQLDWTAIRQALSGKRVLVTGGGGSIGAELCRQVARLGASALGILEQSEYNLYQIERQLRREFPDMELDAALGDVCDAATCRHVLETLRPQVVFHAAAYKHVPLLQQQLREAFRNNVLGTRAIALAADEAGVETFVLISTDKAVNPANVMGATKRIAEIFCQNLAKRSRTCYLTVRFGNVLDSAGSVVPLFREQIRQGGPVTVTHPEISRYFMTIPEACQLILQAATLGQGGEIFALDMGEPIQIRYLAEQMIRLAGKLPGQDIQIVYTGLREGEKLFEELFHEHESYQQTRHQKIFLAQHRAVNLDELTQALHQGDAAVRRYGVDELREILNRFVPEFSGRVSSDDENVLPLRRA
ncbi:MAG: nucleoside-diphosphate sugar epimerase/dehydratase [Lysobacterales bacterium]|nr:polysaccharide biosynthesis protein [Xanthomonadales bacterium]MCB1611277.1 polysaccharide biosynthesis protein [Xanthomonadales bacterium]MCP5475800.1 polysaccharide biosynthesis protein [Rhodanobacteraceae bacterium]